jgi:Cu(I)/Ag(I) efflux system membrane protein CusA/SilA
MIVVVLRHRWTVIACAALVLLATIWPWSRLGSEFMPPLNEGSIMDMPSLQPAVGIGEAKRIVQQRDAALARIPEVRLVLGKIGRAESATDMAPLSMIETIAILKDKALWRPGVTYDSIVSEANATVRTPGVANMWSMPIKNRLDMLSSGIKTPVGIKIFGPNLDTLDRIGHAIEGLLPAVAGTNSVYAEAVDAGYYLDVDIDRVAVARYGLTTDDVQAALSTAVGGGDAGQVIAGRERYGVLVRYPRDFRDSPDVIRQTLVVTPSGAQIPLGAVARIAIVRGPSMIKSENAALNEIVYVDVRGRDVGSYVRDAQRRLATALVLPSGYRLEWSGQFESLQRASQRLRLVIPITLALIALLLYANFRSIAESAIVMLSLPFALVGGVWFLWLLGYNMSVAVAIGFIALAGVAAETGIVMLIYLDQANAAAGTLGTLADVDAAVTHGAVERVRPKLMTVTAIMAGLVPILWSQGVGADVIKRVAAPMVGGMITSTLLTLLVIPAIYSLWKESQIRARRNDTALSATNVDEPDMSSADT